MCQTLRHYTEDRISVALSLRLKWKYLLNISWITQSGKYDAHTHTHTHTRKCAETKSNRRRAECCYRHSVDDSVFIISQLFRFIKKHCETQKRLLFMNFKMFTVHMYIYTLYIGYFNDDLFKNVFSMIIKLIGTRCWEGEQGGKCLLCVI